MAKRIEYVVETYTDPWSKNECEIFSVIQDGEIIWERDYGSTAPVHSAMVSDYWKSEIRRLTDEA